jgi:Fe-S cluster assembly protein SufD
MSLTRNSALPTNRDENWRYANLRPLAKARIEAVAANDSPLPELPAPTPGFARWIFVDGHCIAESPDRRGPAATAIDSHAAGPEFAAVLDGAIAEAGVDFALARSNAAQGSEVLQVTLPDEATANVEVLFIARQGAAQGTSYPRLQAHVGRNAKLNLIERHLSAGDADSVINAAVDVGAASGSRVSHTRLQNVAGAASCFDTLAVNVADNAGYTLRTITLGALASRTTAFIRLAGRAAGCEVGAAIIANHGQTHDMFVEVEHAAPDTTTRELFRGIANERGKLAFNGKMVVREHAHGADSDQSLKSLLTGSGAEAAARPQLEIYTDKVRAKHGATTGKLDEQMLFYLLTRGIERHTAQALLQWAFIEDAVSRVEPVELRREIEALMAARLLAVSGLDGLLGDDP